MTDSNTLVGSSSVVSTSSNDDFVDVENELKELKNLTSLQKESIPQYKQQGSSQPMSSPVSTKHVNSLNNSKLSEDGDKSVKGCDMIYLSEVMPGYVKQNKENKNREINIKDQIKEKYIPSKNGSEVELKENSSIKVITTNVIPKQQIISFNLNVHLETVTSSLGSSYLLGISFEDQETLTIFKNILLLWGIKNIFITSKEDSINITQLSIKDRVVFNAGKTIEIAQLAGGFEAYKKVDRDDFINKVGQFFKKMVYCGPNSCVLYVSPIKQSKHEKNNGQAAFIYFGETVCPLLSRLITFLKNEVGIKEILFLLSSNFSDKESSELKFNSFQIQ